jgi:hypothetical protein
MSYIIPVEQQNKVNQCYFDRQTNSTVYFMIFRLGFDWLLMLILKMAFAGQIRTDKS